MPAIRRAVTAGAGGLESHGQEDDPSRGDSRAHASSQAARTSRAAARDRSVLSSDWRNGRTSHGVVEELLQVVESCEKSLRDPGVVYVDGTDRVSHGREFGPGKPRRNTRPVCGRRRGCDVESRGACAQRKTEAVEVDGVLWRSALPGATGELDDGCPSESVPPPHVLMHFRRGRHEHRPRRVLEEEKGQADFNRRWQERLNLEKQAVVEPRDVEDPSLLDLSCSRPEHW